METNDKMLPCGVQRPHETHTFTFPERGALPRVTYRCPGTAALDDIAEQALRAMHEEPAQNPPSVKEI